MQGPAYRPYVCGSARFSLARPTCPLKIALQTVLASRDRRRPVWLAVARAYEHVERLGWHSGAGRYDAADRRFRGLSITLISEVTQSVCAEVIESRGVWRPGASGPWLDGFGVEVPDEDIEPAWTPGI